jgi:hypothetical protein
MTAQRALLPAMTLLAAAISLGAAPGGAGMPPIESGSIQTVVVSGTIAQTLRGLSGRGVGPAWVGYSVPAVAGDQVICCGDWHDGGWQNGCCGVCRLEKQRGSNVMNSRDEDRIDLEAPWSVVILLRLQDGAVERVRTVSPECRLDAGSLPFYWLTGVDSAASIAWLSFLNEQEDDEEDYDETIMAIAMHKDTAADEVLEKLARKGRSQEEREQATFWMGNARGRRGYEVLLRMLRDERDTEMRKKMIFALSQSPIPESTDAIIHAARHDDDADVRGEALFWLAQQAAERAEGVIAEAIESDPETDVKKKAVFALSQLPKDRGVPLLIDVARGNRNPAIRKEAIFWLGQSGDPRALDFIEEILAAPSRKGI